jgi:signal transduction histidine kinase
MTFAFNTLKELFAPIFQKSSYLYMLYFISSLPVTLFWLLLLGITWFFTLVLSSYRVAEFLRLKRVQLLYGILNFERARANFLLGCRIGMVTAPIPQLYVPLKQDFLEDRYDTAAAVLMTSRMAMAASLPVPAARRFFSDDYAFNVTTGRSMRFLYLNGVLAVIAVLVLTVFGLLTAWLLFAPTMLVGQPPADQFSYYRDSVLWTGSQALKMTPLSSLMAFLAGVSLHSLTVNLSTMVARNWSIKVEDTFSNDKDSSRMERALTKASQSVLSDSTSTALETILNEGMSASSANGAAIGEQAVGLELSVIQTPKPKDTLLRLPLEQQREMLVLFQKSQPSPRDKNLWDALSTHASTALKLQDLLNQERSEASEQERARIARELHDSVAQALYGISLGTRSALEQFENNPSTAKRALEYAMDLADGGTSEMKTLLFALRPDALEEGGLAAALHKLGEMLQLRYKLTTTVDAATEPNWNLEVKSAMYRIAQEAVHNTVKHAKAKHLWIKLDAKSLEIRDDGIGFDTGNTRAGSLGLKNMRERAEGVGGTFELVSSVDSGSSVVVTLGGKA